MRADKHINNDTHAALRTMPHAPRLYRSEIYPAALCLRCRHANAETPRSRNRALAFFARHCAGLEPIRLRYFRAAVKSARRAGNLFSGLGVGVILCAAFTYAYILDSGAARLAPLQETMARWSGVGLLDRDGCFLGIIPGAREGLDDFSDGSRAPADEKTLLTEDVPDGFWKVAVALENRSIGSWRMLPGLGVDPLSTAQALVDTLSGRPRGASTLPQLVAGSLLKTEHGSVRRLVSRKTRELTYGAALYASYSLSTTVTPNLRQLVANYLPLAQSTSTGRGGALYGIGAASLILFGKTPGALSLAEQAVLAAAIKFPIVLAPENDTAGQRLAEAVFARVQRRASYGLNQAYGERDAAAWSAINEISRMPPPEAQLCASLKPYLPADPEEAFRVRFSPTIRAQYFARDEMSQVISELRRIAGPKYRLYIHAVRLSVRASENFGFKRAIAHHLASIEAQIGDRLSTGLVPGSSRPIGDVLVTAADPRGRIRLYFQSPERPLLDISRPTGSVSKTIAAILLSRSGHAADLYCNRWIDGTLRNANGDFGARSCTQPGARVSARDSFRKSLNLPIYDALASNGEDHLRSLLDATEFRAFDNIDLRTAVAFGMVNATPGDMLQLMTAIAAAQDKKAAIARQPHIVETLIWRDPLQIGAAHPRTIDLSDYLRGARAVDFLTDVLSAPLSAGGTAAALESCAQDIAWRFAKTGTVAHEGRVSSKLLLAAATRNAEPITVLGIIGADRSDRDVTPVSTAVLARTICAGLSSSAG